MMRNPYGFSRADEERPSFRDALLEELAPPPPSTARPRTPPPVEESRERLMGPGGRTQDVDTSDTSNAFSGDRWSDERPGADVYQPPSTTPAPTGAQPRETDPFRSNMSRGYALMDEYDDPYTRRNEGAGGAGSGALTGLKYGSAAGPAGMAVGAIAGAIGGAFAKNAKTAVTDFAIEDARDLISQAHEDAFGRPITREYLDQIVRGQGWEDGDRWMGQDSVAYVLDQFASQAPGDRARTTAEDAAAANTTPAETTTTNNGAGTLTQPVAVGDYARNLEGFDMSRFGDPEGRGNSTWKYKVGSVLSKHPPTREGLAAAATELQAAGVDVQQGGKLGDLLVFGDGVVDENGNKIGTIDVGRGFGAAGSGWAWQPPGGGTSSGNTSAGAGAANAQAAYASLINRISPNASKEDMESAITAEFQNVPGFGGAYKESVMLNGQWFDLVRGYGADGAAFQGLVPKADSPRASSLGGTAQPFNLSLANSGSQLPPELRNGPAGATNNMDALLAEIRRIQRGEVSRDALLAQFNA